MKWIDSGEYGKESFKYKHFQYEVDPITQVWVFPDDELEFVEEGPDRQAYPQMGVKFYTDDLGLTAGGLSIERKDDEHFEIIFTQKIQALKLVRLNSVHNFSC